jgi:ubiquinone/menaquinone biosynthesis C-methylase UbiE
MSMPKIDFSQIASKYHDFALVQKSAADILLRLLEIGPDDKVLDLGCGVGNLTEKIRSITGGEVVGTDPSEGMIREAMIQYKKQNITFKVQSAEELAEQNCFDIIFCNSSFQWFKDPDKAIGNCYRALKKNGRFGIQAPAKTMYSPNFIEVIDKVRDDPRTGDIFKKFKNPWFFCETAEEYKILFEKQNFRVPFAEIQCMQEEYTPQEVFNVFMSGASNGYLNQDFYSIEIYPDYIESFNEIVRESFHNQANTKGKVNLIFYRIFLIAVKPG